MVGKLWWGIQPCVHHILLSINSCHLGIKCHFGNIKRLWVLEKGRNVTSKTKQLVHCYLGSLPLSQSESHKDNKTGLKHRTQGTGQRTQGRTTKQTDLRVRHETTRDSRHQTDHMRPLEAIDISCSQTTGHRGLSTIECQQQTLTCPDSPHGWPEPRVLYQVTCDT